MGVRTININDILQSLSGYLEKPPLYEPGEARFWDDDYISKGMLAAHLNQNFDAASRRFETIDKEIEHLVYSGVIKPGDRVLDLGCGPGLYASRLGKRGMKVTGIDISRRSIDYAKKYAAENSLDINYVNSSFFDMEYNGTFDVAMQIYGEVNTLSDDKRDLLLSKIHDALNTDGIFLFDVSTRAQRVKEGARNQWYSFKGGLWRPGRHLILEEGYDYPVNDVWLDQYIVIDENGMAVYRNWFHDYSLKTIVDVLEKARFSVVQVWNDFTGTPYQESGDWIAIVARKM